MKQRLGIANAILHDPELLILDEPINKLDPIGIVEVRNFIKRLSTEQEKTILISSHILSEMALLVDDIGIIDHGVLLVEDSLENLEKKNSRYVHFIVTDTSQAARILEADFHTTNFHIDDNNNLRIYDTKIEVAVITRKWIESGIDILEAHTLNDTLEDYFKHVTGGEGIA
jgi:bacitracin transport system ATP-binding protein